MRILFTDSERKIYFDAISKGTGRTWVNISKSLGVNIKTLNDWRSGKFTIPQAICEKIENEFGVLIPNGVYKKPLFWHTRNAGIKGAQASYLKYGNPGTTDGRRKGGINSLKHLEGTNFKVKKVIDKPKNSKSFAELVGILLGDGGISQYQVVVYLDLYTDREYSRYVCNLFKSLFNLKVSILESRPHSTLEINAHSRAIVEFLEDSGLSIGNKMHNQIDVPSWIKKDTDFSRACLRGMLDTDGCVYTDTHKIGSKVYASTNIAFTSASEKLLKSIFKLLENEGFHPTRSSYRSIRLRRKLEIARFFEIIGSRNPKNLQKYKVFLNREGYSSGHKSTVSKTVGV